MSKAAGRLLDSGVSEVIVTGVLFEEQDAAKECTVGKETGTGGRKVANLTVTREKTTAGISSFYRGKLLGNRRSVRFRNCRRKGSRRPYRRFGQTGGRDDREGC